MLAAVVAAITSAAHAETPAQAPKPAQIDRNGVLMLIRSSLLALDQANKTGNYTVLRDIGAPGFQSNSAARLGEIFAKLRNDNLDLSGVAVIDPQLSLLPQIEANGLMHMTGFFPSVPTQVNFDLSFAPVNGQWRLFGISVSIGQSGPAAPAPPEPPVAQKQPSANGGTKQPAANGTKAPAAAKSAPAIWPAPSDNNPQPK
jgi:cell division septation protein DedD